MTAPHVPDVEIRRAAWGGAYERGVGYARSGAVRRVTWDPDDSTLSGIVAGSRSELYRCSIRLDTSGARPRIMTARCSCPMAEHCKHTVATLVRSNAGAADGVHRDPAPPASPVSAAPMAPAAPGPRAAPPRDAHWRTILGAGADAGRGEGTVALALGVELRVRESRANAVHWGPRRVLPATARSLDAAEPDDITVGVRPLSRSSRSGKWIRSEVSWDALRRAPLRYRRDQFRWFTTLFGIVHDTRVLGGYRDDSEWVTLDSVESSLLWSHLAAADALGIPLVAVSSDQTVTLAPRAHVEVVIGKADAGGLSVAAAVAIGDEVADPGTVRPVGHSGVYRFEVRSGGIALTLAPAPLGDTVHDLLAAGRPVPVPAAEVSDFFAQAYPRLARDGAVVAGAGVTLPAPEQTTLVATVRFLPEDTIRVDLRWQRPGLGRAAFDTSADDPHEAELRRAVERVFTDRGLAVTAAATVTGVDAAEFAVHVLPALEELDGVRVETSGRRRVYRELGGDPRITVKTVETTDADWFDLGILVEIGGHRIPFTPLFRALALRKKKVLLSDGHYFSLAHPALDRLRELIDEAADLPEWESGPRISRYQLPLWEDFEDLADESQPAVAWRAAAEGLRVAAPVAVSVPAALHAELRPYQREGFERLGLWWRHRLGGILADDMGLGKTLQVLALIAHLREGGERRPVLVVAPTSVLATWRAEAARFTPGLRVNLVEETAGKASGAAAAGRMAGADPQAGQPPWSGADVVVTSYTLLRLDADLYAAGDFACVVLDEAQFAKNPRTRVHRAVQALRADMVVAVTGTPLENSLTELWALLALACPGLFPSPRRFREEYVKPIEQGKVPENEEGGPYRERRLERLRSRVRPFVLRRTKELVAPELPPRQEQVLTIELGPAHRAVYDAVLQRERRKVLGLLDDLDRNRFIVFRSLTLLRRLALAPALVDAGDPGIRSAKLDALREQLGELIAEGHRALVFSQFTSYLDLVRADLDAHGIRYAYLDGSTRRRSDVVAGFRGGDVPVFLISLKAGGFGLTLTEADYVFLMDPWWNPAAEAQAVDRTHRIGQTRPVNVYRLISGGTIEEKVVALQQRKARLFQSVMGEDDLLAQSLTAADIRDLLEP